MKNRLPIVRQFMDTGQNTLHASMPVREAVRFLLAEGMTSAPVLDDQAQVVGILSEKDCLQVLTRGDDLPRGTVADYMIKQVITITPEMDVYYAAGVFLKNAFRRLPVVENGRLVGQLTRRDILRAIELNLDADEQMKLRVGLHGSA